MDITQQGTLELEPMPRTRLGRPLYRLGDDVTVRLHADGVQLTVHVPKGTVTDLASVPRVFWPLIPPGGKHTRAAIVHDRLCRTSLNYQVADAVFAAIMKHDGVPLYRRYPMYLCVRLYSFYRGLQCLLRTALKPM